MAPYLNLSNLFGGKIHQFDFNGTKILVPTNKSKTGDIISIEERQRLAKSFYDLNVTVKEAYGTNILPNGPLAGEFAFDNVATFHFQTLEDSLADLKSVFAKKDAINSANRWGRNQHEFFYLFNVDAEDGTIFGIHSKQSPFYSAAKKVDPEFSQPLSQRALQGKPVTVEFFKQVIKQLRTDAVSCLESVDVEATPANIADFLQLLHLKTRKHVTESFTRMPFLKIEKDMDKNLALMVNRKLKYEHLTLFSVMGSYPKTSEELNDMTLIPKQWLFNLTV